MPKAKKLTCSICGKKFSMPAHLARHKSATHGAKKKAPKKKATKKRRKKAASRRGGRPPAIATRFGLKSLPLDDLAALIKAAQAEAAHRLKEYRAMLGK
jgi:hypothetical protein